MREKGRERDRGGHEGKEGRERELNGKGVRERKWINRGTVRRE